MNNETSSPPTQTALVRIADPGSNGLKAERIQDAAAFGDTTGETRCPRLETTPCASGRR